jgi:hypothetical protein
VSLYNLCFSDHSVYIMSGAIGGLILAPGLYKWTTGVSIGSDITITGGATDSEFPVLPLAIARLTDELSL